MTSGLEMSMFLMAALCEVVRHHMREACKFVQQAVLLQELACLYMTNTSRGSGSLEKPGSSPMRPLSDRLQRLKMWGMTRDSSTADRSKQGQPRNGGALAFCEKLLVQATCKHSVQCGTASSCWVSTHATKAAWAVVVMSDCRVMGPTAFISTLVNII